MIFLSSLYYLKTLWKDRNLLKKRLKRENTDQDPIKSSIAEILTYFLLLLLLLLLGFTPCKAGQPLRDMELQEKKKHKKD